MMITSSDNRWQDSSGDTTGIYRGHSRAAGAVAGCRLDGMGQDEVGRLLEVLPVVYDGCVHNIL